MSAKDSTKEDGGLSSLRHDRGDNERISALTVHSNKDVTVHDIHKVFYDTLIQKKQEKVMGVGGVPDSPGKKQTLQ